MDAFGLEIKYGMYIEDFRCISVNAIYHNVTQFMNISWNEEQQRASKRGSLSTCCSEQKRLIVGLLQSLTEAASLLNYK